MKILINTPQISILGGVANHYLGLQSFWEEDVRYNSIGSRNKISGMVLFPFDIVKFILKCVLINPDLVVVNPSLHKKAITRDAIYLKVANFLGIKTLVFFHGWNCNEQERISKNPSSFFKKYQRAAGFLVLSNSFLLDLKSWGFTNPIFLTTTKVNDTLLTDFSIDAKDYSKCNVLFLSRIEKEKGVFIALQAFEEIKKEIPTATLTVVGDGKALTEAKQFVNINSIPDVLFTGALKGDALINAFQDTAIYLFPTQNGEGMPTSVLEAMAFGMPIITRPVGGLNDFFQNQKMGQLIESNNPIEFAQAVCSLFNNRLVLTEIGHQNHLYAKHHFYASVVSKKMETLFKSFNT